MQAKKPFLVSVTITGWVFAEDQINAERFAQAIIDTEVIYDVSVEEFSPEALSRSLWEDSCLVYHSQQRVRDITLKDAIEGVRDFEPLYR